MPSRLSGRAATDSAGRARRDGCGRSSRCDGSGGGAVGLPLSGGHRQSAADPRLPVKTSHDRDGFSAQQTLAYKFRLDESHIRAILYCYNSIL